MIRDIFLKDFRCFSTPQTIELAPITILTGENSCGKTAFLAAIRLAWDSVHLSEPLNFNEEPFDLGSFEQIAHYHGGSRGRSQTFEIGLTEIQEDSKGNTPRKISVFTTYSKNKGLPEVTKQRYYSVDNHFSLDFLDNGAAEFTSLQDDGTEKNKVDPLLVPNMRRRGGANFLLSYSAHLLSRASTRLDSNSDTELIGLLDKASTTLTQRILTHDSSLDKRPFAAAPVRSKPRRTYDPFSFVPTSEGQHIPYVLSNIFQEDRPEWERLNDSLVKFGVSSGLFKDIAIRPLGQEGDSFRLNIKISNLMRPIVDVGYGVSQILPLLIEILTSKRDRTLLIQQPEVHLHPKAQAELASFIVEAHKTLGVRFVIETHSDYFVDRLRSTIRQKQSLKRDDISILFFYMKKSESAIEKIEIDELGNIIKSPKNYRNFFMEEERRMLGF